jgi:hypothetical protein
MGAGSSPSEVASRVYTRNATSDIKVTSRDPGGSPRLLFRPACTHGTRFPTAVGPRGSPPSNTSPRVYTRDGLSDIRPASRRRKAPSPSEFAHRVYTWDEILDTGHLEASGSLGPEPRRPRRGIGGLRMGGPHAFRASRPLHARRVTVTPVLELLHAGEGRRGGSGASRGRPTGSRLRMCALLPDPSRHGCSPTSRFPSWTPISLATMAAGSRGECSHREAAANRGAERWSPGSRLRM